MALSEDSAGATGAGRRDRAGGDARELGLGLGLGLVEADASSSDAVDSSSSDAAVGAARETIWGARTTRGARRRGVGRRRRRGTRPRVRRARDDRGPRGTRTSAGRRRRPSRARPRPRPSPTRARDRRGGGAPWWRNPEDPTTRARVASLAVAVEPSGVTSPTRTVSSARVRPDILAPRDRPPRGDLRRAREKPAGEESRHARGRRACRCSASRRTARFSSRRRLLADDARPPPERGERFPRARRAVPCHRITHFLVVPRARRVRVHALHTPRPRLRPSSARRLAAKRRRLRRSNPDGSDRRIPTVPVGSSPHDATRPRAPPPAPHALPADSSTGAALPPFVFDPPRPARASSLRTNIFASALAFAARARVRVGRPASSFASRETFFPPGALFSFSVARIPDDDDTGEPAADADGGGGRFRAPRTRLERRRHRPFAHAPASASPATRASSSRTRAGSNAGESGRPPFDPAFVADDDAFFVVADDAVFSISAGPERDEGASERDGGASNAWATRSRPSPPATTTILSAPTALVRSGETALAVVSAAGGDAPSFSFASVSVSFASSFSFSGARLMTLQGGGALGVPTRAASAAATAPPALVQPPRSRQVSTALAATATEGGGPGGSGGAAPGGRGCGAAPASISRDLDVLPRLARPESEFRPDPEDRPVSAPGGGGGAFGGARARVGSERVRSARPGRSARGVRPPP